MERWFHDFLERKAAEMSAEPCPQELGIDEHFFTKKKGFATTFCDLKTRSMTWFWGALSSPYRAICND